MLNQGTPCSSTDINVANRSELILRVMQNKGDNLISVDAGCGYGAYLHTLAKKSSRIIGIDINLSFLTQARNQNTNTAFSQMSLDSLALSAEYADFISCIETLEHVERDNDVIKEFSRVLKPGGHLIISVPYKGFPFETHGIQLGKKVISSPFGLGFPLLTYLPDGLRKYFATARVYTRRSLVKMLKANGFIIEQISFLMPGLDIFERKSRFVLGTRFLRWVLHMIQNVFHNIWGSTIVIVARIPVLE